MNIKEIREKTEKATRGPWVWQGIELGRFGLHSDEVVLSHTNSVDPNTIHGYLNKNNFIVWWKCVLGSIGLESELKAPYDADFIAMSREAIPFLLELVDEAKTIIDRAQYFPMAMGLSDTELCLKWLSKWSGE